MDPLRSWGPTRAASVEAFLDQVVTLPYDSRVSAVWGQLQAYAQMRGRPRPVNDTWIAACCLARDLPLASFTIKDFEDYAEHEGLRLLT